MEGYTLSPYAVPTLLTGLTALGLGVVVLLRERHSAVGRRFCLMALPVAVWLLGQSGIYCSADGDTALAWQRVTFVGVPFIPVSIYHFSALFLGLHEKRRILLWLAWGAALGFAVSGVVGSAAFTHMRLYWWGYYPIYGTLRTPFLVFFVCLLLACLSDYWRAYHREKPGRQRQRIRSLLTGFAIAYLSAVDFLPTWGLAFYPFGYLPVLVFLAIAAYTVRRYRLIDIVPAFAANQIVNTMADSLVVCDAEGTIRVANPAVCAKLARARNELIGQPITVLLPQDAGAVERFLRLLQGPAVLGEEMLFVDKNGHPVDMSVSVSHLRDDDRSTVGCVVIAHDIRERKRDQARLREEAEISGALARVGRQLISAIDRPVLLEQLCQLTTEVLDADVSLTLFSKDSARALTPLAAYGASEEETEATRFIHVPRDVMSDLFARFETDDVALAGSVPDDLREPRYRVEAVSPPYLCMALRRGSEIIGVQVALWRSTPPPLTHRRQRIARGIAQLASLALENARLMAELNAADKIKSDFVATMSHELRTPLGVIIGYADLLVDRVVGPLNDEQTDMLNRMRRSSFDLLELISSTLDMSRLQRGRIELSLATISLADLIEQIAEETVVQREKPGVTVLWNVPRTLPSVRTDPSKLKVVLKNLILNAVKFTNEGSVKVAATAVNDGIEWVVRDTGIGIAPEMLPYAFEPFRQLHRPGERRYGGVGLGLYIVKRLVELLEGRIAAESELGRGTTFRVWVPLQVSSEQAPEESAEADRTVAVAARRPGPPLQAVR